jgi:flagellar basal body-associated protein FliL
MEGTEAPKGKKPMKWYFIVLITLAVAGVVGYFFWPATCCTKATVKYDPLTGKPLESAAGFNPTTGKPLTA